MKIAEVIVNIVHSEVDKIFDYLIPLDNSSIKVGTEVSVPFKARTVSGFVISIKEHSNIESHRLRKINNVLHEGTVLLSKELIELAIKMAEYYMVPKALALDCIVPGGLRGLSEELKIRRKTVLTLTDNYQQVKQNISKRAKRQLQITSYLEHNGSTELQLLKEKLKLKSYDSINKLVNMGVVRKQLIETYRNPLIMYDHEVTPDIVLNTYQSSAVNQVVANLENEDYNTFLLHGVTGSGKTEVYLRCINHCLLLQKEAILLVPEITLTPQTIERLKSRFGSEIAVLHSSLSKGERYDEWRRISNGQAKVVVGARSAVFAPVNNLGLIVIDEEHESTYKQQDNLRYDARQIALWRARSNQSTILLGSATPAITSFFKAKMGIYKLLSMPERITKHNLPKVELVDMREEIKSGNKGILSNYLKNELVTRVKEKNEKAIILLNRRGFSSFLRCNECGEVFICPNCNVSLTYHSTDRTLKCHYCDYHIPAINKCNNCKQSSLKLVGTGTQKIEYILSKLLPKTDIIRMDSDTTNKKNAHYHLLEKFKRSESAVLIGTQMIAKGLDIKEITLVGVIDADIGLNMPDYRADERSFQLLTQVAGRSGRGDKTGKVIIQTFMPNHYSIKKACTHDFIGFYNQEIDFRKKYLYPPFTQLIRIICVHDEEKIARRGVEFIYENLDLKDNNYQVLNPTPAPINKIKKKFRWHIIIKYNNKNSIHHKILSIVNDLRKRSSKIELPLRIIIDINPENIL